MATVAAGVGDAGAGVTALVEVGCVGDTGVAVGVVFVGVSD